jgi:hypothetical protein
LCSYPYSREVWFHICQTLGHDLPAPAPSVLAWWRRVRWGGHGHQRKGIDSLFALVSWQLWKERNACCFMDATTSVNDILLIIKAEADLWIQAGAKNLGSLASGGRGWWAVRYSPRSQCKQQPEPSLGRRTVQNLYSLFNTMIRNTLVYSRKKIHKSILDTGALKPHLSSGERMLPQLRLQRWARASWTAGAFAWGRPGLVVGRRHEQTAAGLV